MSEEGSGVSKRPLSPCGHSNPPNARFCDACGVRLPTACARCHAINRAEANFCSNCGASLRDAPRTHAAARGESPDRFPQAEAGRAPAALATARRPEPAEPEAVTGPPSFDPLPWAAGEAPIAGESEELRERVGRLHARRRRARRRAWLGTAGTVVGIGAVALLLFGGLPSRSRSRADGSAGAIPAGSTRDESGNAVRTQAATASRDGHVPAGLSQNDEQKWTALTPDATGTAAAPLPLIDPRPRQMASAADVIERPAAAQPTPPAKADIADASASPAPPPSAEKSPGVAPALPRRGGELTFIVPAEPPSYDAHREETFAVIHPAAPHYNTLLRIDPSDKTGTRVVGDLAESWAVSPDKRTYVLKLRRGVKFHDGSEMTSRDVRATYEKIITPPPGVTSARKGEYLEIETVQAPEPYVVAFKLKWPSPSFIHSLASPWNWIYKADILERDVHWYETHVMGTGPFVFVEHVKGSHWLGRRNPDYWDTGKPYLDGYRALFVRDDAAQAFAIRAERAHIQFRGFSPAQRDTIVRALGDKVTVQESPWNCGLVLAINHEKKPFDDRRVRRALSLALDRYEAAGALSKIAIVREVAGVQVPGSPFAATPAELARLAGYGRDIRKSRAEARRLLADAGIDSGFSFVLKNRNVPMPYEYVGTWLVDQWRQIGIKVHQEVQESGLYFRDLRAGTFEVSTDFQCGYVVDPDLDLYKFQSRHLSDANYGRYTDPVLDDLYVLQSRTVDPVERRRHIRAFERRLLDEEAHYIYTLQWHRIVPHSARVRGWTITPSHYLNNQLDAVWLAE